MQNKDVFSADLIKEIRSQFQNIDSDPITGERIYFENAGGTLKLKSIFPVIDLFTRLPDNAGRRNKTSKEIDRILTKGRDDVALFLGARSGHVISEQSGTGMSFRILSTIARSIKGSNIVTSNLDHPAVYDTCHILAKRHGLECRVAPLDRDTGCVSAPGVSRLIDRDTVMLAIIHASNNIGTVNEVVRIVKDARGIKPDIYIVLDGCQYVSHGVIDVETYGADAWFFDAYKVYSKIGTNFAHISERLSALDRDNLLGKPAGDWDLGTREAAAFACISCVVEYFQWLGSYFTKNKEPREMILAAMEAIDDHEKQLIKWMLHGTDNAPGLLSIKNITVYGETSDLSKRQAIFAFNVKNVSSADVVDYLELNGIRVHNRTSDAYSRHTLEGLGISECVRVSLCHYNTKQEIERFLELIGGYK